MAFTSNNITFTGLDQMTTGTLTYVSDGTGVTYQSPGYVTVNSVEIHVVHLEDDQVKRKKQ